MSRLVFKMYSEMSMLSGTGSGHKSETFLRKKRKKQRLPLLKARWRSRSLNLRLSLYRLRCPLQTLNVEGSIYLLVLLIYKEFSKNLGKKRKQEEKKLNGRLKKLRQVQKEKQIFP